MNQNKHKEERSDLKSFIFQYVKNNLDIDDYTLNRLYSMSMNSLQQFIAKNTTKRFINLGSYMKLQFNKEKLKNSINDNESNSKESILYKTILKNLNKNE